MNQLTLQSVDDSVIENQHTQSCNLKNYDKSPPKTAISYKTQGSLEERSNTQFFNNSQIIQQKNKRDLQQKIKMFNKVKQPPKVGPKNGRFFYCSMFNPPVQSKEQKQMKQYLEEQAKIQQQQDKLQGIVHHEQHEEPMDKTEFKEYMINTFMNRKYNVKVENQLQNLKVGKRKLEKEFNKKMYFQPNENLDFKAYLTQELQNISDISQHYNQNHVQEFKMKPIITTKYWNQQFCQNMLHDEYMYYHNKMNNQTINSNDQILKGGGGYTFKHIQQQFEVAWNNRLIQITSRLDPKELKSLYFVLQAGEAKSDMTKQGLLDSAAQYLMEKQIDLRHFHTKEIKEATQRMQSTVEEMKKLRQEKLQMSSMYNSIQRQKSISVANERLKQQQESQYLQNQKSQQIEAINEEEEENESIDDQRRKSTKKVTSQLSINIENDNNSIQSLYDVNQQECGFSYLNLNTQDEIKINHRISLADLVGEEIKRLENIGEIPHSPSYHDKRQKIEKNQVLETLNEIKNQEQKNIQKIKSRNQNKRQSCQQYILSPIKQKQKLGIHALTETDYVESPNLNKFRQVLEENKNSSQIESKYTKIMEQRQNENGIFNFKQQNIKKSQKQQENKSKNLSRNSSIQSEDSQKSPLRNPMIREKYTVQELRKQSIQNLKILNGGSINPKMKNIDSQVVKQLQNQKELEEIQKEQNNQEQIQKMIQISQKQRQSQLRQSLQLKMSSINSLDNYIKSLKKNDYNDKIRDIILMSTMEQYEDVFGSDKNGSILSDSNSSCSDDQKSPIKKFKKEAIKRLTNKQNLRESLIQKTEPAFQEGRIDNEFEDSQIDQEDLINLVNNNVIENIQTTTLSLIQKMQFSAPNLNQKLVQQIKNSGIQQEKPIKENKKKESKGDYIIRKCEGILSKWDGREYSTFHQSRKEIIEKSQKYQKSKQNYRKKKV